MKNIFFLIILFFIGAAFIKADEGSDGDFLSLLAKVKNPFMTDFPQPKAIVTPESLRPQAPLKETPKPPVKVKRVVLPPKVVLPADLKLQGVIAGEDMHQAIINGQVLDLQGTIEGAQVVSITKDGVELLFKGKKFFLKAD